MTVLGDRIGLPLALGTAAHLDGLDPIAFDGIATVVGPEEAQVTIGFGAALTGANSGCRARLWRGWPVSVAG